MIDRATELREQMKIIDEVTNRDGGPHSDEIWRLKVLEAELDGILSERVKLQKLIEELRTYYLPDDRNKEIPLISKTKLSKLLEQK